MQNLKFPKKNATCAGQLYYTSPCQVSARDTSVCFFVLPFHLHVPLRFGMNVRGGVVRTHSFLRACIRGGTVRLLALYSIPDFTDS